jgi:hypothetical protein
MGVFNKFIPVYGGIFVNIFQIYHRNECELHHVAPCDEAIKGRPSPLYSR